MRNLAAVIKTAEIPVEVSNIVTEQNAEVRRQLLSGIMEGHTVS